MDLKTIVEIEKKCFSTYPLTYRNFAYLMKFGNCDFVVVETDGRVIGYAISLYKKNSTEARIYSIVIIPEFQKQHLGKTLLEKLETLATSKTCRRMRLEVDSSNFAAVRFYEKQGFKKSGTIDHYYGQNKPALRFKKSLI